MRKAFLLAISFCMVFGQFALAQTDKNVPAAVTSAFKAKYPNMTVTDWDWESDKELYEAEFKMNGREHEAYFTPDGTWKKTKTDIKKEKLPAAVNRALTQGDFSGWNLSDYAEMDTPDKGKVYKVKAKRDMETRYLKYDPNGNLVEEMDREEKKAMQKK